MISDLKIFRDKGGLLKLKLPAGIFYVTNANKKNFFDYYEKNKNERKYFTG